MPHKRRMMNEKAFSECIGSTERRRLENEIAPIIREDHSMCKDKQLG